MADPTQPVQPTPASAGPVHPSPAAPVQPVSQPGPRQPAPPQAATFVPAAKPSGGFSRGFGTGAGLGIGLGLVLAIGMVVSSIVLAFAGLGAQGVSQTPTLETLWGRDSAGRTIRAVSISGAILGDSADGSTLTGGTYGYELAEIIDAIATEDADGLMVLVNTPGGTINGSAAIADAIARYQERTGNQVVVHVRGMSASGGVYSTAGADLIIADHGSLVGSIGVIFGPFTRFHEVTATTGSLLESGVVTSGGIDQYYLTQGRNKDFGNAFRDMTDEERQVIMTGLEKSYAGFVGRVAAGRGISEKSIVDGLGANIFDAETAVEKGLVDKVAGVNEAYTEAATVMGLDPADTKVVSEGEPDLLSQLLGVEARVPGHAAALADGEVSSRTLCGATPTALVFHGSLATVCG